MTLLVAFQGKKCALLASDLLVDFVGRDQLALPPEQRTYTKVVCEKVRRTRHGDYMAYSGRLNSGENAHLYAMSLEDITNQAPWTDARFRADVFASLFFVSLRPAQLYVGTPSVPFAPVGPQYPFWCTPVADSQVSQALTSVTDRLCHSTALRDAGFLRELSAAYADVILAEEKKADAIGGYSSYLFKPGKARNLTRRPGKLKAGPRGRFGEDGCLVADLPLTADAEPVE